MLGFVAWQSIRSQEQLVRQELRTQYEREAATLSVELGAFVDRVLDELMTTLRDAPSEDTVTALAGLERTEPFIARTFVLDTDGGVRLPAGDAAADAPFADHIRTTRRNHPEWPTALTLRAVAPSAQKRVVAEARPEPVAAEALPQARRRSEADQAVREISTRQYIARNLAEPPELGLSEESVAPSQPKIARSQSRALLDSEATVDAFSSPPAQTVERPMIRSSGWTIWPEPDEPGIVGWVETQQDPAIASVVIDMDFLKENLRVLIPRSDETALQVRIVDPHGRSILGKEPPDPGTVADFRYALGSILTNWSVDLQLAPGWDRTTESIRALGQWVLLAMIAAILGGGTLLLWQAERARRDALQKSNFVSTVSHELRTPLTSIQLYAGMLAEERVSDPAKRAAYGKRILGETERLTRLVTNILGHQKRANSSTHPTESNPASAPAPPLLLTDYLNAQAEHFRPLLEQAGLQLIDEIADAPHAAVSISPDALGQCLTNLIDNAIKYAGPGKTVTLKSSIHPTRQSAVINVADNGPGVPLRLRKRIFEPFYQCDRKLTDTTTGLGIGLSLCQSLLREAGGSIICQPPEADTSGAVFRIELPVNNAPSAPPRANT